MSIYRRIATPVAALTLAAGMTAGTIGSAMSAEVLVGPELRTFVTGQQRVIVLNEDRGRILLQGDQAILVQPGGERVTGTYEVQERQGCFDISALEQRCYTFYRESPQRIQVQIPDGSAAGTVIVE